MGTWNGCGEQPVSFLFPMRLNLGALSGAQLLTRRVVGGMLDWCGEAAREFPLFSHVRLYSGNAQRSGAEVLTSALQGPSTVFGSWHLGRVRGSRE